MASPLALPWAATVEEPPVQEQPQVSTPRSLHLKGIWSYSQLWLTETPRSLWVLMWLKVAASSQSNGFPVKFT
jgi:hypothetical protein